MRISDWSSDVCSSDLFAVLDDRGAQHDAAIHIAVGREIADAARIGAARIGFEFGDDLAGADLGRAADSAGGKAREQRVDRVLAGRDAADDVRDDVHDMAVELDGIAVGDAHAAADRSARSEEHTSELQSLMRLSYAV